MTDLYMVLGALALFCMGFVWGAAVATYLLTRGKRDD